MQQLQCRLLSGRTALVEGVDDVASLRECIAVLENIPVDEIRLTRSGRDLRDGCLQPLDDGSGGATITVLLRLMGGKGGFGAMLRTAGARGVKTTNFDACRDLNGRRLRHVNSEAALREWDAQAEARKLKKQQDAAKNAKPHGPALVGRFDDEEYEDMLEGARNRVSDALAAATGASTSTSTGSSSGDGGSGTAASSTEAAKGPNVVAAGGLAIDAGNGSGDASSTANGKRKAPATVPVPASAPKTAKLWDPLAMLEGEGEDESGASDGGEEGANA